MYLYRASCNDMPCPRLRGAARPERGASQAAPGACCRAGQRLEPPQERRQLEEFLRAHGLSLWRTGMPYSGAGPVSEGALRGGSPAGSLSRVRAAAKFGDRRGRLVRPLAPRPAIDPVPCGFSSVFVCVHPLRNPPEHSAAAGTFTSGRRFPMVPGSAPDPRTDTDGTAGTERNPLRPEEDEEDSPRAPTSPRHV
ncbi:hypothetical protein COCON_G00088230 [Conger conger]|uniref:Uncharacterized protein n=1 Tax=Conger conger TaxID=82655 RepID=A0A9Q1DKG8_CONCO|nr:hypothetical protein COCON_G00088230 [Conger conger]